MRAALGIGLVITGLILAGSLQATSAILFEDFEDGIFDSRITIETVGTFISQPGIKDITNFGSSRAFGYGKSTCLVNCFDNYVTDFKIILPESTYISAVSFKEIELYDNWGSKGKIYLDGNPITEEGQDFGRSPSNDWEADTEYRSRNYLIDQFVTTIELKVADITQKSEIFIDDFGIYSGALIVVEIPDVSAGRSQSIAVPIKVSDATGIASAEITIAYNPDLLTALDAQTTGLSAGFSIADSVSDGQIAISLAQATGIAAGSGSLVNVNFQVNSTANLGDTCSLVLQSVSLFNENTEEILADTDNSLFTVGPGGLDNLVVSPTVDTVEIGQTITFTARGYAQGTPVSVSPSWSVTGGIGTVTPTTGSSTVFTATTLGLGEIIATQNSFSDEATVIVAKSMTITESPEEVFVLPNPFTPNDDGFNDRVLFMFPGMFEVESEILLFDISGRGVKRIAVSNGQLSGWDGKDADGNLFEPGVYIYIIRVNGNNIANGTITLMR